MYFPVLLFPSLLWKRGRKKNKGEPEQWESNGRGSRCEALGDGLCSCVTFLSAFTLILSSCPVLIFSWTFFCFYHCFILLHPFLLSVSCRIFPLFCTPPPPPSFCLHACRRSRHFCSFPLTSPLLQSQLSDLHPKHSKLISLSGSLDYLRQRVEPARNNLNDWLCLFTAFLRRLFTLKVRRLGRAKHPCLDPTDLCHPSPLPRPPPHSSNVDADSSKMTRSWSGVFRRF